MAQAAMPEVSSTRAEKRAPRARPRSRRTNGSRTRKSTRSVGELEQVIRALEERLEALTSRENIRSAVSTASNQVGNVMTSATHHMGDLVADTLTEVAGKLRGSATSVTGAAKIGTGAMQRIGQELERRPMMTVAIALGIGFLAGLTGRRE